LLLLAHERPEFAFETNMAAEPSFDIELQPLPWRRESGGTSAELVSRLGTTDRYLMLSDPRPTTMLAMMACARRKCAQIVVVASIASLASHHSLLLPAVSYDLPLQMPLLTSGSPLCQQSHLLWTAPTSMRS
jgi:hypothetical protein